MIQRPDMPTFNVPLRFMEIDGQGMHVAVSGFVNGNLSNILIDTGASRSVFDKNRLNLFSEQTNFEPSEKLSKGLGTDGMEGFRFTVDQFIIGDLLLEGFELVALDLSHINEYYGQLGLVQVDMILGGDFLKDHGAVIDYGTAKLMLSY